ncbi:hypothetical protein BD413DRAFT_300771 [Trametes elegans]|nr:hypothetical protein BD413DRAFT_300771 [Trametes elegans]
MAPPASHPPKSGSRLVDSPRQAQLCAREHPCRRAPDTLADFGLPGAKGLQPLAEAPHRVRTPLRPARRWPRAPSFRPGAVPSVALAGVRAETTDVLHCAFGTEGEEMRTRLREGIRAKLIRGVWDEDGGRRGAAQDCGMARWSRGRLLGAYVRCRV